MLGSATPSLESVENAVAERYERLLLPVDACTTISMFPLRPSSGEMMGSSMASTAVSRTDGKDDDVGLGMDGSSTTGRFEKNSALNWSTFGKN